MLNCTSDTCGYYNINEIEGHLSVFKERHFHDYVS